MKWPARGRQAIWSELVAINFIANGWPEIGSVSRAANEICNVRILNGAKGPKVAECPNALAKFIFCFSEWEPSVREAMGWIELSMSTNTFGGIPDRVPNVALYPDHQGVRSWFNPTAFTAPQPGHFGNAGAYSIEGQGLISSDLSINKSFPITERVRFNLLGAASDVFNHPHFNTFSTNLSAATAGQYTSVVPDYVGYRSGRRMISIKARVEYLRTT